MRIKNSINNISISIITQIVITLLGFFSRKVFLDNLGIDYLGINGLLTNVLSILGLAESGIGLSIIYNLYKPLADDNKEKVIALVQLYKKAYTILAFIILGLSLLLLPFLEILMKDGESISYLPIIYFIFVFKNMISYLNAHKWSLINADQKGYIISRVDLVFQVITTILKIIILLITKNYILYLLIEVLIYVFQNFYNGRIVNSRYPYIKTKVKYTIDQITKENIIKNVKALFLHSIGGYFVFGTDNILISSFIGVAAVGLYSNYTMIVGQLSVLVTPILDGIGASVGNLIATEDNNKSYSIFKVAYLVNFWFFSLSTIFLYNLLEPFIQWWIGGKYLLSHETFIFILINFYITGLRSSISTFKNKAGLFVQDKYMPLIEAFINLGSSILLIKYFGLAGVFMGTTISSIVTIFWTQPLIVFKHLFKISVWKYFQRYLFYAFLTIFSCYITSIVSNILASGANIPSMIVKGLICLMLPNIIYVIIFFKSEEFLYLKNALSGTFIKLKVKRKITSTS